MELKLKAIKRVPIYALKKATQVMPCMNQLCTFKYSRAAGEKKKFIWKHGLDDLKTSPDFRIENIAGDGDGSGGGGGGGIVVVTAIIITGGGGRGEKETALPNAKFSIWHHPDGAKMRHRDDLNLSPSV